MIELAIVFGAVAALSLFGVVAPLVPPHLWVDGGIGLMWAGMVFGVPAGLWYHVLLARALRPIGALPERWWLRPTALHGALPVAARRPVLFWCGFGALGFVVAVAGCLAVAVGVLLEARRAGVL